MSTLVLQPGSSGVDTYITTTDANYHYGTSPYLDVGTSSAGFRHRSLLYFDLSAVPAGATVVSATLQLYCFNGVGAPGVEVHRSYVQWYETPYANYGSTWNHRQAETGTPWAGGPGGGAGSDYEPGAIDIEVVSGVGYYNFTVTNHVAGFVSGSFPNYGWWLVQYGEGGGENLVLFDSSDSSNTTRRPKLTVVYNIYRSGTIGGSSSTTGHLKGVRRLTGQAAGTSSYNAPAFTNLIAGSISGASSSIANLYAVVEIPPGTAAGTSTAVGSLVHVEWAEGSAQGIATAQATGQLIGKLRGDTAGTSTAVGNIIRRFYQRGKATRTGGTPLPLLYLSDGRIINGKLNRFNLIDPFSGYILDDWLPLVAQFKGSGVYSDSALASGRELVHYVYENPIETFTLRARAHDQNQLIHYTQELLRWTRRSVDFWVSDRAASPIYLTAKAAFERNPRYAVVYGASVPELSNPYGVPFYGGRNPVYDKITLLLERGHWQDVPPGESTCTPIGNQKIWSFPVWENVITPPTGTVGSLVEAGDGSFLAGMRTSGEVWRSTDGQTWSLYATLGASGVRNIDKLIRVNPNTLYAAVNGSGTAGIYKSTDHGQTWTEVVGSVAGVTSGPQYWDIYYDQPRNRILAAGGGNIDGQVLRGIVSESKDGGATWRHWWNTTYTYYSSVVVDTQGRVVVGIGGPNGTILCSTQQWFELETPVSTFDPATPSVYGGSVTAWFRAHDLLATVGDGNPVTTWYSAANNYRAISLSPSQSPTLVAGQLNGYPVVRFDGVNDFLDTAGSVVSPPLVPLTLNPQGPFLVVMLIKDSKANGESHTVFGETGTTANAGRYYFEIRRTVNQMYLNTNFYRQNINTSLGLDEYHIVSIEFRAPGIPRRIYVDGILVATGSTVESANPVATPSGEGIRLGSRGGTGYFFDGDIAEFMVFNVPLEEEYRVKVEQYLSIKYNLTNTFYDFKVVGAYLPYGTEDLVRSGDTILQSSHTTSITADDGTIRYVVPPTTAYVVSTLSKVLRVLYVDPKDNNWIWGGAVGDIYKSENKGLTWKLVTSFPSSSILAFLRTAEGALIAAGTNEIVILEPGGVIEGEITSNTTGLRSVCEEYLPIANGSSRSNLTSAFVFDASAGTYTSIFPDVPLPVYLLPSSPAVGDILYVGSQTGITGTDTGPFWSVVFDIDKNRNANRLVITWEYWNGSAWTTLAVRDNTGNFVATGLNSVHWQPPSNWATTTVNGIAGWWVRARITSIDNSDTTDDPHSPRQANQNLYSANVPYVEIPQGAVGGEISALSRILWKNSGANGSNALEINRLVVGLRSFPQNGNGASEIYFEPFLNISDQQNPFGITVLNNQGTFSASIDTATGRKLCVSLTSGADSWQNLATISLDTTIAQVYYGRFRAFLRCNRTNGTVTDWKVRLCIKYGSSGIEILSNKEPYIESTAVGYIADLGSVMVPSMAAQELQQNIPDALKLIVQGYADNTGINLCLFDLVLIPIDEWSIDVINPTALTTGVHDSTLEVATGDSLDIDSLVLKPSSVVTSKRNQGGLIEGLYTSITNGPGILQVGALQRLYFLAMSKQLASPYPWVSYPAMAGSVRVNKVQRYLSARGKQ